MSGTPAKPLHFGPAERACFGWYHAPSGLGRNTGVVLCNPIGDDYTRAHRTLLHLAEQLARAGFAVLRFDFYGTGDSAGDERADGIVRTWREDIRLAADELRAISGAVHIALVGLRLGATLAAIGAADAKADSVVLWNPYLTGSAFASDLARLHQMHKMIEPQSFACEPAGWSAGGEEALGFLMTPSTIADLGAMDLLALRGKVTHHTLLIGTGNVPGDEPLDKVLRAIGPEPAYRHMPGHKFLITQPHKSEVPQPILDAICDWLVERHPAATARAGSGARGHAEHGGPIDVGRGVEELPLELGREHPLFGILARPRKDDASRRGTRPAIILTNAGCVHRIGPHRFYVPLARRWAELGFHVLRMDLAGIGDSPAAPGARENQMYPASGLADLHAAMHALEERFGLRRFVVVGLGSGADLAFQAGQRDGRVAGTVMMNPRTFGVHDPETVRTYNRARYLGDSLLRAASWKKALRGQVDFRRAVGIVAPRVTGVIKRRVEGLFGRKAAHQEDDVPASLRHMAERGVDTLLVAATGDPGIDFVDGNFGKGMSGLADLPNFRRADVPGTDHTFTSLFSQQHVSQLVTDHLTLQHLGRK